MIHLKTLGVQIWKPNPDYLLGKDRHFINLLSNIPLTDAMSDLMLSICVRSAFCCTDACISPRSDVTFAFSMSSDLRNSSIHSAVDLRFGSSTKSRCRMQFCGNYYLGINNMLFKKR